MKQDFIIERLNATPAKSQRGDDDLNPGMVPIRDPLTPAAVLVPLVLRPEGVTLLLTKRTAHLNDHAGQVSFPGGRVEISDANRIATALRETTEEVGVHPRHITPIGNLDIYITRTGFEVTPVIGILNPPFEQKPDPFEVAEIFEVPLDFFMDRANHERHSYDFNGSTRYFHAMPYNDYYIWGVTAGIIVNLVDILSEGKNIK